MVGITGSGNCCDQLAVNGVQIVSILVTDMQCVLIIFVGWACNGCNQYFWEVWCIQHIIISKPKCTCSIYEHSNQRASISSINCTNTITHELVLFVAACIIQCNCCLCAVYYTVNLVTGNNKCSGSVRRWTVSTYAGLLQSVSTIRLTCPAGNLHSCSDNVQ